jgi:hypothetical protein
MPDAQLITNPGVLEARNQGQINTMPVQINTMPVQINTTDVLSDQRSSECVSEEPTSRPETGQSLAVTKELVGRLAFLFHGKTGVPFSSTQEQRQELERLMTAWGEQDIVQAFAGWLKRPQGVGGLEWPLAKFMDDYAAYSPAFRERIKAGLEQSTAQANASAPLARTSEELMRPRPTGRKVNLDDPEIKAKLEYLKHLGDKPK